MATATDVAQMWAHPATRHITRGLRGVVDTTQQPSGPHPTSARHRSGQQLRLIEAPPAEPGWSGRHPRNHSRDRRDCRDGISQLSHKRCCPVVLEAANQTDDIAAIVPTGQTFLKTGYLKLDRVQMLCHGVNVDTPSDTLLDRPNGSVTVAGLPYSVPE